MIVTGLDTFTAPRIDRPHSPKSGTGLWSVLAVSEGPFGATMSVGSAMKNCSTG